MVKKDRNSTFELMRILAMMMIVIYHSFVHGEIDFPNSKISLNYLLYILSLITGKIGVNVFVLISGYFLIENNKEKIDIRKICKLWGQIVFYSIITEIISYVIGYNAPSIKSIIAMFLPITYTSWWFASTYFVLYIIHPYINLFLNYISQKTYKHFLFIIIVLWSIIPTILSSSFEGNSLIWFVVLYSCAAYIRKYENDIETIKKSKLFICIPLLSILLLFIFSIISIQIPILNSYVTDIYEKNSIFILILSLFVFIDFKSIKIENNKIINTISSATFAVYLIHDIPVIRKLLWNKIFTNIIYQNSPLLIVYSVFCSLIVFIVCSLIDFLRQNILEKKYLTIIDKIIVKYESINK